MSLLEEMIDLLYNKQNRKNYEASLKVRLPSYPRGSGKLGIDDEHINKFIKFRRKHSTRWR